MASEKITAIIEELKVLTVLEQNSYTLLKKNSAYQLQQQL